MTDKEFVTQYISFSELKKVGFFSKEIKRTNYEAIVSRFLTFFGQTKEQYILNQPTFNLQVHPDFVTGKKSHFKNTVRLTTHGICTTYKRRTSKAPIANPASPFLLPFLFSVLSSCLWSLSFALSISRHSLASLFFA